MTSEIILVGQTAYNPYVALARDILKRYRIPYHEVNIETIPSGQVSNWPDNLQSPTLFITQPEQDCAVSVEALLAAVDTGSILRRPVNQQLEDWLHEYGFLSTPYRR